MGMPPTGTVTFLFTDIEGSTRLWGQQPASMRLALARHDELLREVIEGREGYVFKTVGDAFCAAFATAPQALEAALMAQLALAAEPWGPQTPLKVRMALHTGAAEERGGDYFGQPLNRVARLLAAGHGGQTLLSLAAQELTRDHLPAGLGLRDLGDACLRDLSRPERVFQLLHPSLPGEFPPLKSLDNPALPNNLPYQATSFVGREKEVGQVRTLLEGARLVTLAGAGGAGKSRLSLQAAADLLDRYPDGVWLVELAPLADPALVPQAVADVLGVKEQPGQPFLRTLTDRLRPKRLLLVLDNCEHLIAACAALATELLRYCPDVRLLASSREPLNAPGEQVYRVPSLSLPDPTQTPTAQSLSQYESVRLFLERVQAVRPGFAVSDASAPAVAQVCWRLDGIPLALELAAARVRSLPVEEVSARLDDRFRLLTGGSRTLLPRQQTLRALIDWSYDLLSAPERAALQRLSVCAGGWMLSAAEAMCAGDGIEDWEALDLLTGLVDKSLVVYEEDSGGRYRLLETVRQYGLDRLTESGEAAAARGRHRDHFLAFSQEAARYLYEAAADIWVSRLEAEHDNLRAALAWCEQDPAGADAGQRISGDLARFWEVHGHLTEGRGWLDRALGRPTDLSDPERIRVRARALSGAGNLARMQGDYAAAETILQEALALVRLSGDLKRIATALNNLGAATYDRGDLPAARALCAEGLRIRREIGDTAGIATSLTVLALMDCDEGDYAAARASFEEALALRRKVGNRERIAASLHNLGLVAEYEGDAVSARARYSEGLAIRREIGDQQGLAGSLEGLARVAALQGSSGRSVRLWGAAAALRERLDTPLPPGEARKWDAALAEARTALGGDAFVAVRDAGAAMTLEQALEDALSDAPRHRSGAARRKKPPLSPHD